MASTRVVTIVGGGMAGAEAAWQLARRGLRVRLYEMRPRRETPVHTSDQLAEMVCSNSLRSDSLDNAVGLLHEEMRRLDSIFMSAADNNRVPAGKALAVDRRAFAREITERIASLAAVEIIREEVVEVPDGPAIIATGPLTSDALSDSIRELTGAEGLHFYDAVSPIVRADTIDGDKTFAASRYGKGGDDYLNCPLDEAQFQRFYDELMAAELVALKDFEEGLFFEGCLPIEEQARRGPRTLTFGPMKPVGLEDPRTGERPFAVAQLRQDDLAAEHYSMVGFQTRMKWGEQDRVFRLIPGLEKADFVRFGVVHRNTYINAPRVLSETLQTRQRGELFFAGQVAGTEGYVESAAGGLLAGIYCGMLLEDGAIEPVPRTTALGSLAFYISHARAINYQPTNITFGIMPPLDRRIRNRKERREAIARRSLADLEAWRTAALAPAGRQDHPKTVTGGPVAAN